jgi:hypothetical protein
MIEPLHVIRDMTEALTAAGVEHWLFGGWAIDFHLGMITRPHDDIDVIIWSHDRAHLSMVLQRHAFQPIVAPSSEHLYFAKAGQWIEISFIERHHSGAIITPGRWADWPWQDGAFTAGRRQLHGVWCSVTNLACIIESKQEFQTHAPDQPLRQKDRDDLAHVHKLFQKI